MQEATVRVTIAGSPPNAPAGSLWLSNSDRPPFRGLRPYARLAVRGDRRPRPGQPAGMTTGYWSWPKDRGPALTRPTRTPSTCRSRPAPRLSQNPLRELPPSSPFTLVVPVPIRRTVVRELGWDGPRRVLRGSSLALAPIQSTAETVSFAAEQQEVTVWRQVSRRTWAHADRRDQ